MHAARQYWNSSTLCAARLKPRPFCASSSVVRTRQTPDPRLRKCNTIVNAKPRTTAGRNQRRRRAESGRGNSLRLAIHELREMIVNGKLLPGTWLIEAELAERLGFSRTPIRGALHWLQGERYVLASGNGAKSRLMVAPLTREDARELYSIIGHLEGLGARLTARLPSQARSTVLRQIVEYNSGLAELAQRHRSEANRIFELDMNFHRTIVEASAGRLGSWNSTRPFSRKQNATGVCTRAPFWMNWINR
jgi:hypothetical protein